MEDKFFCLDDTEAINWLLGLDKIFKWLFFHFCFWSARVWKELGVWSFVVNSIEFCSIHFLLEILYLFCVT